MDNEEILLFVLIVVFGVIPWFYGFIKIGSYLIALFESKPWFG